MSNNATESNFSTYSDLCKDLNGIRPARGCWDSLTEAQQVARIDVVDADLGVVLETRREFGPVPVSPFADLADQMLARAIDDLEQRGGV